MYLSNVSGLPLVWGGARRPATTAAPVVSAPVVTRAASVPASGATAQPFTPYVQQIKTAPAPTTAKPLEFEIPQPQQIVVQQFAPPEAAAGTVVEQTTMPAAAQPAPAAGRGWLLALAALGLLLVLSTRKRRSHV